MDFLDSISPPAGSLPPPTTLDLLDFGSSAALQVSSVLTDPILDLTPPELIPLEELNAISPYPNPRFAPSPFQYIIEVPDYMSAPTSPSVASIIAPPPSPDLGLLPKSLPPRHPSSVSSLPPASPAARAVRKAAEDHANRLFLASFVPPEHRHIIMDKDKWYDVMGAVFTHIASSGLKLTYDRATDSCVLSPILD